ncbi:MAG TPA: response regulator, partial [Anaerolineales bacterium]|nr:response regulator [Anaerolineales bacterium]
DPDISDLVGRQALQPLGYQLTLTGDAAAAIKSAVHNPPDLIIANLNLPGLSGKDLITALTSQGISAPLIVIAEKGQEQSAIHSFRLGAADVILWPARDAEVVRVVERALQQTHEARARLQLDRQLEAANQELQRTVRELTTLLSIGKAVTSTTDPRRLFDQIVEGAMQVAEAETSWLMVRDENKRVFLLTAHRNLPESWAKKINQPLDDGISSLVAVSAETLSIHGAPLEKFKVAALGKSAAVVPIKVQSEVIGLLIVVRKAEREIDKVAQTLLEAVADYASISLVNARLFRVVEQNVEAARFNEKHRLAMLESLKESIRDEMQVSLYPLEALLSGKPGSLTSEQEQALKTIQSSLQRLARSAEKTIAPDAAKKGNG